MKSITLTRTIAAPRERVEAEMADLEPFMRAAGFDEVTVEGETMTLAKAVGLLKISLELEILETDAALAYEQREGIFESMRTTYELDEGEAGTTVTVETTFALDAPGGSLLDATVIKRQRTKEIEAQFDYLESAVEE